MACTARPGWNFLVLGQLYRGNSFPHCPVEDSGDASLKICQRVSRWICPPNLSLNKITSYLAKNYFNCHGLLRDLVLRKLWGTLAGHPAGKTLIPIPARLLELRKGPGGADLPNPLKITQNQCKTVDLFTDKLKQEFLSGCIRLGLMQCLTILSPFRKIRVH